MSKRQNTTRDTKHDPTPPDGVCDVRSETPLPPPQKTQEPTASATPPAPKGGDAEVAAPQTLNGGRVSISPPAKVKKGERKKAEVLLSGIDTLYLSLEIGWAGIDLFDYLHEKKNKAKASKGLEPISFNTRIGMIWFGIKGYGKDGYEWLLENNEFRIQIGPPSPNKTRPDVYIRISSEALWTYGPKQCIDRIRAILAVWHARIKSIKPSRVDLCADILMKARNWTPSLRNCIVCRAKKIGRYESGNDFEGIRIGEGQITARLYDKPLEILRKSNKTWFYDLWHLDSIPDDLRVVRIEFQLRREAIIKAGIKTLEDLWQREARLWVYCTTSWLRLETPGKHHTQRKLLPWWLLVQQSYEGAQNAEAIVMVKAVKIDKEMLISRMFGDMTSLAADGPLGNKVAHGGKCSDEELYAYCIEAQRKKKRKKDTTESIRKKLPRYRRGDAQDNQGGAA